MKSCEMIGGITMATKLEEYQNYRDMYNEQLEKGQMEVKSMIYLCELNYRIEVMNEFRMFYKITPRTMNEDDIGYHIGFISLFIGILGKEKRYSKVTDESGEKKKEAAKAYFMNVAEEGEKQLLKQTITSPEQYRKYMSDYCNTVLIAWIQMRETFINIEGGIQNGAVNR